MRAILKIDGVNGVDYMGVSQVVFKKDTTLQGFRFNESAFTGDEQYFVLTGVFPELPLDDTILEEAKREKLEEALTFIQSAEIAKLVLVIPTEQIKQFADVDLDPWYRTMPDEVLDKQIEQGYVFSEVPLPKHIEFKLILPKECVNIPLAHDLTITYLPCDEEGDGVF